MKHVFLYLCLCWLTAATAQAQLFREYQPKRFNWGAKVGFTSAFPVINNFTIDGAKVENINTEYKVGVLASLFCRINIDRFFIQPGVEWTAAKSDLYFSIPDAGNGLPNNNAEEIQPSNHSRLKFQSAGVPVLIGYYLIKEGPYGLSLMVGPKIKYNYKNAYVSYEGDGKKEYRSDSTPWNIGIVTGVGVSIWRLFFDFTYEFGINSSDANFYEKLSSLPLTKDTRIDKHTNMMSFSLGFLF